MMEVPKTDLLGEMRGQHDMLVLCISMDVNMQLSSVAAMSLPGDNNKAIFTIRKVVVVHTRSHRDTFNGR